MFKLIRYLTGSQEYNTSRRLPVDLRREPQTRKEAFKRNIDDIRRF